MIMLQKHVCMSDTFSVFVIANQTYTNGIVAAYSSVKNINFLRGRRFFSR